MKNFFRHEKFYPWALIVMVSAHKAMKNITTRWKTASVSSSVVIALFAFILPCIAIAQVTPKGFTKQDILQCGENIIVVTTSCLEREENLAYCFNQNIAFVQKDGDLISFVNYNYQFNDGNQEFIAGARCVKDEKKSYLVVSNTNFANCKICEWADIFSNNGKYIGSTEGMYKAKNFLHKPVPPSLQSRILHSASSKSSESNGTAVEISRTLH